jgi:hypothetical protein
VTGVDFVVVRKSSAARAALDLIGDKNFVASPRFT